MNDLTISIEHTDDGTSGAYYVPGEGSERLAAMTYFYPDPKTVVVEKTEVSEALRGQGVGMTLLGEIVRMARERGLTVSATCDYAKPQLEQRENFADVYRG